MEFKPVKKQDIPIKIRVRKILLDYFWPFFGIILTVLSSCIILLFTNIHIAVTFWIFFLWFFYDFLSPNAIFLRKFINYKPKDEKTMNEFTSSYLYLNTGNYIFVSEKDILGKIINFFKEEFERFLRFVLHPLVLIPYSIFTFFYYDKFLKYGEGAPFLYFSAILLLWYTNETFMIRKNNGKEHVSRAGRNNTGKNV
jgi:hypothetical protein